MDRNPFFCPDAEAARAWEEYLERSAEPARPCGAVIEVVAEGVPPGLGAPLYGKLDADIAGALMGINAVKGVEIGDGFAAAGLRGEENADEMRMQGGQIEFGSNHAGGVSGRHRHRAAGGGALRGQADQLDPRPVQSVNADGEDVDVVTRGRHDPCVGIRAVPVGEAMVACVLADHCCGTGRSWVKPQTAGIAKQSARTIYRPHHIGATWNFSASTGLG